jgi:hypothetical protein
VAEKFLQNAPSEGNASAGFSRYIRPAPAAVYHLWRAPDIRV